MYITAHRVRSRRDEEGINSLRYAHSAEEAEQIDWKDDRVVLVVADEMNGQLVTQSYDVPPGGNRVLTYLDVAAPEGTKPEAIEQALSRFRQQLESELPPMQRNLAGIGIRFSTNIGLEAQRSEEFDALCTRVMLMARTEEPSTRDEPPLVVIVQATEHGFSFALTKDSVQRVRKAHGSATFTPGTFRVTRDTLLDFNMIHGDLVPHLISSLTKLRLENVIAIGGVRFIDTEGNELRTWPSK